MLFPNLLIPLAGLLAALYLAWFATWLLPPLGVRRVHVSFRSLRSLSGYPMGLREGEKNGGARV